MASNDAVAERSVVVLEAQESKAIEIRAQHCMAIGGERLQINHVRTDGQHGGLSAESKLVSILDDTCPDGAAPHRRHDCVTDLSSVCGLSRLHPYESPRMPVGRGY